MTRKYQPLHEKNIMFCQSQRNNSVARVLKLKLKILVEIIHYFRLW